MLLVLGLSLAVPATGDGLRFERVVSGLPETGQWRNGLAVVDVDGDGQPDIVHGPPRRSRGRPHIFFGRGDASFAESTELAFADLPFDYGDAAAADFDGDGRTDLAFAVHLGGLAALLAGPEGRFETVVPGLELLAPGSASFSSRSIETVDWNGDGRMDLVALGEGPSRGSVAGRRGFAVFLNREDGFEALPQPEDVSFGDSLAIGDVNGDGRADAVVASRRLDDRNALRLQQKDGSWKVAALAGVRARSYFPAVEILDVEDGRVVELALAWVELDGADWRSGIDLHRQTEQGWRRIELHAEEGAIEVRALAAGDLDADGRRDLVAGNLRGEVLVFVGREDGSLERLPSDALADAGGGCSAFSANLTDLDADGRPEIVLGFAGEPQPGACAKGGSLQVWRALDVTEAR